MQTKPAGDEVIDGEAGGELGKIGQELYGLAKKILKLRKRVRDGTLQWRTFQNRMIPLMRHVEQLRHTERTRGALCGANTDGMCDLPFARAKCY